MQFTLGDIADMLKQIHVLGEENQRLKLHIQELEEARDRKVKDADPSSTGSGDRRDVI